MASLGAGGHDVMANLAARLMGRRAGTTPNATQAVPVAAAATPRTMPSPQVQVAETNRLDPPRPSPFPAVTENVRPRATAAPTSSESSAPLPSRTVIQPAPTPTVPNQEVTSVDVNRGPSLYGDPDSIKVGLSLILVEALLTLKQEAREFSQSAKSSGGKKSQYNRGRVASADRSSSGSRSPRSSVATTMARSGGYPPLPTTSRAGQSSRSQTGSLPESPMVPSTLTDKSRPVATGYGELHGRPSAAPSKPEIKTWSAFATNAAAKKEADGIEAVTKSLQRVDISSTGPSTPSPAKKTEPVKATDAWQLTDITNTLKDRAVDVKSPPHSRAKPATPVTNTKPATEVGTASNPIVIDVEKKAMKITSNGAINGSSTTETQPLGSPMTTPLGSSNMAQSKPSYGSGPSKISDATPDEPASKLANGDSAPLKDSQSKPSPINGATTKATTAAASTTSGDPKSSKDDMLMMMEELRKELVVLTERMKTLEQENFTLQKQLENLQQGEERRKYLGTDSANVPFGIEVHLRE